MHINIIDPGMRTYAGHHCDVNARVARELTSRGHSVTIYANQSFHPKQKDLDLQVKAAFSSDPYSLRGAAKGLRRYFKSGKDFDFSAQQFANELRQAGPADALLLPTLFPYQLHGLCRVTRDLPPTLLVVHNSPGWSVAFGEDLWRKAFEACAPSSRSLHLGVFENELLMEYERLLPNGELKLTRFPIPHDGVSPKSRVALSILGIVGHQRQTKGLGHLSQNVDRIIQMGFNVIVQDSGEPPLHKVMPDSPALSCFGYVDDLASLIGACDALFLDYDPTMYRRGGSGIAWEAIACGVPLIVPDGTTMSVLVEMYQCGVTFAPNDPDAKFSALQIARDNYAELASNAAKASNHYRSIHGTDRFVDFLLDRAKPTFMP